MGLQEFLLNQKSYLHYRLLISLREESLIMILKMIRPHNSQRYHQISTDSSDAAGHEDIKPNSTVQTTAQWVSDNWAFRHVCPWVCAVGCVALLSTYLLFSRLSAKSSAYPTDLPDAHPYVLYEERVFIGRFNYNESTGLIYKEVDPTSTQYFGNPSPQIDAAWDDLLRGEFVEMTEKEAAPYTPELQRTPGGRMYFTLSIALTQSAKRSTGPIIPNMRRAKRPSHITRPISLITGTGFT
ncbi:hypothetical protein BJX63DRAFT_426843 [Aspergillus granulosus]|uniref:Uncharacterized protein n=1 Tax=Aspergillus granulosus TaxID=176169 RepID=A0ABR4I5K2_9EURO